MPLRLKPHVLDLMNNIKHRSHIAILFGCGENRMRELFNIGKDPRFVSTEVLDYISDKMQVPSSQLVEEIEETLPATA